MKFLLNVYQRPSMVVSPPEDERDELLDHEEFVTMVTESGELVGVEAIADPSTGAVVRVRGGVPTVTDGPYLQAEDFVAGYYVVDCESRERAVELAALAPGARFLGVEVRPLMGSAGMEM
ncbi:YciI family protein [Actinopolymorpha pittospori]|uniref:YCII-related domain-containing protein n=1 Tax=Actinopolymorpha pittospori TaxID=648752 RepID=A0A927MUL6_9ACTN|nr:YciI family protein [Actinopolymorpha pittospori]MBE1607176.1 hypothetical protein [Actinopolymorpha pittospori]